MIIIIDYGRPRIFQVVKLADFGLYYMTENGTHCHFPVGYAYMHTRRAFALTDVRLNNNFMIIIIL